MAKKDHLGSVVVYALAMVGVAVILLVAGAAMAQGQCASHEVMGAKLEKDYSEVPTGIGLALDGRMVEILVSPEGTFSITMTRPDGFSCIVIWGEDFEPRPAMPDIGS